MKEINPRVVLAAASAFSALAGAAASYVVTMKVMESKFQKQLHDEVQDARAFFQQMYSTPTFVEVPAETEKALVVKETQVDRVGAALESLESYQPTQEDEVDRKPVIVNNIFTNATPPGTEVLAALMATRDPAEPYIITREEFYENEPDFEQQQFTYWEGDDILVDDREEFNPVDSDQVAGDDNLMRFGYGSGDENVLYVRNETLDPPMDLHITKSSGKYADEVMAIGSEDDTPHLQHSQRRFRIRDE